MTLLQMFVRRSVLLFFRLPVFDETLVTHLSIVAVLFFFLFHPQAEMHLRQSFLAVVSYASPFSSLYRYTWCCAAFVTFPLCTASAPLRVGEKYLRELFLTLRALFNTWSFAAFVTFSLSTAFAPLIVGEKYLHELFLALRALARYIFLHFGP